MRWIALAFQQRDPGPCPGSNVCVSAQCAFQVVGNKRRGHLDGVLRATLRVSRLVYEMDLRAEYLPLVVVFIFACCSNGEATYNVYTGVFVYTSICSATCFASLCGYCIVLISWLYALTNQQPYNSMYQAHTLDSYSHSWAS